jgi:methyl-accepting chemotaxis protein
MFNTTLKTELAARTAEVTEYKGLISALERSMAVVEFDLNGKVLRANDNFLKTLGYSRDQLAGKSHREFCLPALTNSPAYRHLQTRGRPRQDHLAGGKLQPGAG